MLSVSIVHYLFGFHFFYKRIFKFNSGEADIRQNSYDEERYQFFAEYDRCNPATKAVASRDFLEYLKRKLIYCLILTL